MESVWHSGAKKPEFPSLKNDIKTDVLIIGGGIAGLLCAKELGDRGVDCALVEADEICSGVTEDTTAKITAQHGLCYAKMIKKLGSERAKMILEANSQAVLRFGEMCSGIDCDFEEKDAFVYSVYDEKPLLREQSALLRLGLNAKIVNEIPLPFKTVGAICFKNQAQFNPLKFLYSICENMNIYEHTRVTEMRSLTAVTDGGTIEADKVICATHFPFINKHGLYPFKLYQSRSYVLALENAGQVDGMYIDEAENGLSFRNYKNYLLLGGGGHRTGKKGGNYEELCEFAKKYYPDSEEKYRWAAQDCMTLDGAPYIGLYSKGTPDFYVLTGFNKWGMTSSSVGAQILADMITGKKNRFAQAFLPSRSVLHPQLAVNAFEAVTNLLTPTKPRCPHMGCALKWNETEKSWDCPCHGSRFSKDGILLNNPAEHDISPPKR